MSKALIEFISQTAIGTLVIGASSNRGFLRSVLLLPIFFVYLEPIWLFNHLNELDDAKQGILMVNFSNSSNVLSQKIQAD